MKPTLDYIPEGQMSMFDYMNDEKFPPVINELSSDLKSFLEIRKEEYEIWEHVPNLGYRYSCIAKNPINKREETVNKLMKLEKEYAKQKLEVSASLMMAFKRDKVIEFYISTLWRDKVRAKNG